MSCSSSAVVEVAGAGGAVGRGLGEAILRADDLATVVPRNQRTKDNVQTAEAGGEIPVSPSRRREQCADAERHEREAHDRNHAHRECAAGDDAGAVEQEPRAGYQPRRFDADESDRKDTADNKWRQKRKHEPTARAAEKG